MLSLRVSSSKLGSTLLNLLQGAQYYFSIINERKTHSNFQLIIITHDENFLRKLGQSDVMEYYWFVPLFILFQQPISTLMARRISRDSKQKSVIERQQFR